MPSARVERPYADPTSELLQQGIAELVADPDERPPRVERSGDDVEYVRRLSSSSSRPRYALSSSGLVVEKARRAADEHPLVVRDGCLEHRPDRVEERPLGAGGRVLEAAPELLRPGSRADGLLVEIGARPLG